MRAPVCIDLFCGKGGWTDGFLAAGYRVIGVDIMHYEGYKGEFVQADILTLDGRLLAGADVIVASPPCQEFSRHTMPWTRAKNPPPPSLAFVQASWRIRDEAQPRAFILENVRGAQQFIGKAILRRGSFFLWGDIPLAPYMNGVKKKESYGSQQQADRARIPFDLSYGIAVSLLAATPH